jgi:hypothetical protein
MACSRTFDTGLVPYSTRNGVGILATCCAAYPSSSKIIPTNLVAGTMREGESTDEPSKNSRLLFLRSAMLDLILSMRMRGKQSPFGGMGAVLERRSPDWGKGGLTLTSFLASVSSF